MKLRKLSDLKDVKEENWDGRQAGQCGGGKFDTHMMRRMVMMMMMMMMQIMMMRTMMMNLTGKCGSAGDQVEGNGAAS